MTAYLIIGVALGLGLAIRSIYLEYKQDKKMGELTRDNVSLCGILERKIEQMPPGELGKRLGVKF